MTWCGLPLQCSRPWGVPRTAVGPTNEPLAHWGMEYGQEQTGPPSSTSNCSCPGQTGPTCLEVLLAKTRHVPCLSCTVPSHSGSWCPWGSFVLRMLYKPAEHYSHLTELESSEGRVQIPVFLKSSLGHSDAAYAGIWGLLLWVLLLLLWSSSLSSLIISDNPERFFLQQPYKGSHQTCILGRENLSSSCQVNSQAPTHFQNCARH